MQCSCGWEGVAFPSAIMASLGFWILLSNVHNVHIVHIVQMCTLCILCKCIYCQMYILHIVYYTYCAHYQMYTLCNYGFPPRCRRETRLNSPMCTLALIEQRVNVITGVITDDQVLKPKNESQYLGSSSCLTVQSFCQTVNWSFFITQSIGLFCFLSCQVVSFVTLSSRQTLTGVFSPKADIQAADAVFKTLQCNNIMHRNILPNVQDHCPQAIYICKHCANHVCDLRFAKICTAPKSAIKYSSPS